MWNNPQARRLSAPEIETKITFAIAAIAALLISLSA